MGGEGGYQMGFQLTPLTVDGGLDTSLDKTGEMHSLQYDQLYKLAIENRENGNKLVKEGQHEQAITRYSEAIMQLRALENETDVRWNDDARLKVRELRAAAYLNLSLCFLKVEQWTHCINTATRALQGDKSPPDPREAVLTSDKRAKALFRRAQAQCEGFGNFDKAQEDLRKALEYTPDDKAIEQMLRKCEFAVKKTSKKADKKMQGFLKKEAASGEGLFDDSLRGSSVTEPKQPTEPMKLSDGLFIMPKAEESPVVESESGHQLDLDELSREINEMREEQPEKYAQLRDKIRHQLEEEAAPEDAADAAEPSAGVASEAAP